jgi:hypothetical protein
MVKPTHIDEDIAWMKTPSDPMGSAFGMHEGLLRHRGTKRAAHHE